MDTFMITEQRTIESVGDIPTLTLHLESSGEETLDGNNKGVLF